MGSVLRGTGGTGGCLKDSEYAAPSKWSFKGSPNSVPCLWHGSFALKIQKLLQAMSTKRAFNGRKLHRAHPQMIQETLRRRGIPSCLCGHWVSTSPFLSHHCFVCVPPEGPRSGLPPCLDLCSERQWLIPTFPPAVPESLQVQGKERNLIGSSWANRKDDQDPFFTQHKACG